jgi:hypothetical protein
MPDFEEGRTEPVEYMGAPVDMTEVMANTPVAVALLEVRKQPRPSRFDSPSQRRSRLFAVVRRRSCRFEKRGPGTWQAARP